MGAMRQPITWGLVAFLTAYHGFALRRSTNWKPQWTAVDLRLDRGDREVGRWPLWLNRPKPADWDRSARALGTIGYLIRYYAGQLPDFVLEAGRGRAKRFYYRPDLLVQHASAKGSLMDRMVKRVDQSLRELASTGATVVLLPVPTKLSIERDLLGSRLPPPRIWERTETGDGEDSYGVYRVIQEAFPDRTVDLYRVFAQYRRLHPDRDLYIPSDCHWTSLGVALGAVSVLNHLKERRRVSGQWSPEQVGTYGPNYWYWMLTTLQIPESTLARLPEFRWIEPLYGLSGPPPTPPKDFRRILLPGTSFSHRLKERGMSLGHLLSGALGLPVENFSQPRGGTLGSLQEMRRKGIQPGSGDLVVWEFYIKEAGAMDPEIFWVDFHEQEKVAGVP